MQSNYIDTLITKIHQADAILVGIGSGMSSASGYNHYHYNDMFKMHFKDFEEKYGIQNLFQGFYHIYSTPEQQWGFYCRYIKFMEKAPAGQTYIDLYEILKAKEYFIITTNCDIQISKVFPQDKIFDFQGDFRYFQCSQPCHDKLYKSSEFVDDMLDKMQDLEVPSMLIPRCPQCGWKMIPWVQDNTFLQGKNWKEAYRKYESFVQTYHNKQLLLLELGVGDMTPSVIKLPFWDMTSKFSNTFLVTVNLAKSSSPEHLKGKCLTINGDLSHVLKQIRRKME